VPTVSIIIPTNRSHDVLEPCLRSIARQRTNLADLEVIVVFNGGAPIPRWDAGQWPFRLICERIEQAHIGAAKNVALDRAQGEWLILLNDDVILEPDFVEAHLAAHRQAGQPAMVLGRSPWRWYEEETVFDRMIQTTSMIFFYDNMKAHAWDNFRHAWNLNLSLPRHPVERLRFDERLGPFFYEDLELAFRLERQLGLRVWYAPQAVLLHDHRYTLDSYLAREFAMGQAALRLWRCNPDCFRAAYRADLDATYVGFCRQYVEREGAREAELEASLRAVVERPLAELGPRGELRRDLIRVLYHAHLPLKRLAFRRGLLSAVSEVTRSEPAAAIPCPV
jgi:GT2 family glycosyltransferase